MSRYLWYELCASAAFIHKKTPVPSSWQRYTKQRPSGLLAKKCADLEKYWYILIGLHQISIDRNNIYWIYTQMRRCNHYERLHTLLMCFQFIPIAWGRPRRPVHSIRTWRSAIIMWQSRKPRTHTQLTRDRAVTMAVTWRYSRFEDNKHVCYDIWVTCVFQSMPGISIIIDYIYNVMLIYIDYHCAEQYTIVYFLSDFFIWSQIRSQKII